MSRLFFFISLWFWAIHSSAQFNWVDLGVDGLTCSQCSRSVEMEIRKLDFVQDVQMDLQHTRGKITFKPGAEVYIEKIAHAVKNAGFSVRYLKADLSLTNIRVNESGYLTYENRTYQFINSNTLTSKSEVLIQFIGKDYLPKAEYKAWQRQLKPKCGDKGKLFYVTLV